MRLQSRGLGRKELIMDFREYSVTRQDDEIIISGTITEPVHWDFSIRMCEDDLAGITHVAARRPLIALIIRSLFKRQKNHHWTTDRETHLEQIKERRRGRDTGPMDAPIDLPGSGAEAARVPNAARLAAIQAARQAVSERSAEAAVGAVSANSAEPEASVVPPAPSDFSNLRPSINRTARTRRGLVLASGGGASVEESAEPDDGTAVGL